VIRRPVRLLAIGVALLGQFVGAFGLPAARGSAGAPDAACGCCPADRTAGRCCCTHGPDTSCCSPPGEELAPCCRGKKAAPTGVVWVVPSLRSKCLGPSDTVPESIIPTSIPPEPATGWANDADDAGLVPADQLTFASRSFAPDVPPPRS
jgi:hypothetical protein